MTIVREEQVRQSESQQWLKHSGLKAETECLIIDVEGQSVARSNYQTDATINGQPSYTT